MSGYLIEPLKLVIKN